jgi:Fe-S-cluster containining protein
MVKKKEFRCNRCGKCCSPIVTLSEDDIETIKQLGFNEKDFTMEDPFDSSKKVLKNERNRCIFLEMEDGKSRCKIYSNRPEICRKYPFFDCKVIDDCRPDTIFEDSFNAARELINKRGFI